MEYQSTYEDLIKIFTNITDEGDMVALFEDLFTPAELKDFTLRWELLNELYQHVPQRQIAKELQISLCKITRGSKILKNPESPIRKELSRRYDDHLHR
jgi:Trp operon repressor